MQIFSEMIRTSSGQELERRLSETLGMMEIKRAWTSSRLFADHPVLDHCTVHCKHLREV